MFAICVQLADFCSIRLSCIALYGQILKTLPSGSLDEICSEINKIIEVSMKLSSELIKPLQVIHASEIKVLTPSSTI